MFSIPEKVKIVLPRQIYPTSRLIWYRYQVLHAPTPQHCVRYLQALTLDEAMHVFAEVILEAQKHEIAHPEYRDAADTVTQYLAQLLSTTWMQHPLPVAPIHKEGSSCK